MRKYAVKAVPRNDGKTWGWHIMREGRVTASGKSIPVQRSVEKYSTEEDALLAADKALGEFIAALGLVNAKRR